MAHFPRYKVYAAIEEEYNEGWVWICTPWCASRTLVKLSREKNGRLWSTYCEARHIDWNFLERYHSPERNRAKIARPSEALVISEWYRNALGGLETGTYEEILIQPLSRSTWGRGPIWAASHHPDIVARIGTRLGLLGAWLGLVAIMPTVWDHRYPISSLIRRDAPLSVVHWLDSLNAVDKGAHGRFLLVFTVVTILTAIAGWAVSRGPKRPRDTRPARRCDPCESEIRRKQDDDPECTRGEWEHYHRVMPHAVSQSSSPPTHK
jgi:hypothetical protein